MWRKKSTGADKVNPPSKGLEDELCKLSIEKAELESDLNNLNDRLSDAISELHAKDDLIKKHEKMTRDAMEGWEKAEATCLILKQGLDEALRSKTSGEERIAHLDASLKECMQQLHFVRGEQEQRFHDAVMKTTQEFEKSKLILEEKLKETSAFLARFTTENTQLSKALLAKEHYIDDLVKKKIHLEAEFDALGTRLDAMEKDNVSLRYEVRVLEKELEIRNEEREFNRRTADASHKQHLESVKKIAKLESECQRLRLLVRKRLPGPAAVAKMKSEVEFLSRDVVDGRRRRSNSNPSGLNIDYTAEISPDDKKINLLAEQLCATEEENKSLRDALNKKANELQFSRTMYARTASKLSQVESHLDDLSKVRPMSDSLANGLVSQELSLATMSDVGSDDKASCAESWASALISELEHFKSGKQKGSPSSKTVGASDMNLMDDFVEMERLAIVSVDKQSESPCVSTDGTTAIIGPLDSDLNGYFSDVTSKEIVPISKFCSTKSEKEMSPHLLNNKDPGWLQDIVKGILEQSCITQRKPNEILEDVKSALASVNSTSTSEFADARASIITSSAPYLPHTSGSENPAKWEVVDASCKVTDDVLLADKSNILFQSELGTSLCKIIELIEGLHAPSFSVGTSDSLSREDKSLLPCKVAETNAGYVVRLFQWKASELGDVLQQFVHSCYELLNGKSNMTKFVQDFNSALDWTVNHCFSLQDVSSMKYAIKKHFDWDESRSEFEAEFGCVSLFSEVEKLCLPHEQLATIAASNGHYNNCKKDELPVLRSKNKKLNDELVSLDSDKKELEGRLQSAVDKSESLLNQLQESEQTIESLHMELEALRRSKEEMEIQIENHKLMKQDLDTQLTVTKAELNDTRQNFACLEVELENKSSRCQELDTTCLDLQLQLESVKNDVIHVDGLHLEDKQLQLHQEGEQLRTDREITAASEKLAECQETILNLGKQLKALASPRDAAMFDKVIRNPFDRNGASGTISADAATATASNTDSSNNGTTTNTKNKMITQRSSLLDQMMAEDSVKEKDTKSTKSKTGSKTSTSGFITNEVIDHLEKILMLDGNRSQNDGVTSKSLAVVASKRNGGGSLWKKLLWRKRSGGKKRSLPFTI